MNVYILTEFLHINLISLLAHHTGLHSPLSLARIPTQTQAHIHMRIIANTLKPTERNAFTLYTVSAKSFHCGGSVHSVHQSARVSPASLCHNSLRCVCACPFSTYLPIITPNTITSIIAIRWPVLLSI